MPRRRPASISDWAQFESGAGDVAKACGLGEAVTGAAFLGAKTSLPECATTLTAAIDGHADTAVANALGGVAAQMTCLSIADISYRRANLEHAAASLSNIMQAAWLVVLLALVLFGVAGA